MHKSDRREDGTGDTRCLGLRIGVTSVQVSPGTEFHNEEELVPVLKGLNRTDWKEWERLEPHRSHYY